MRLIIKFTLSLLIISNSCFGQFTPHHDSIYWTRSIRFGCDISRFALPFINSGQKGIEFSGDFRLTTKVYPIVELGEEEVDFKNSLITQTANGQYMRIGCDINMRNYVKDFSNNLIFFGFRYGIGNVNYSINNYTIADSIYGNQQGSIGNTHTYAQWIEALAGVRVEIIKNIFLGWSIRGKLLLSNPQNNVSSNHNISPYIIPGYGYGINSMNVGVSYSIFYQIPLMRMKSHYKVAKKQNHETPKKTISNTSSP